MKRIAANVTSLMTIVLLLSAAGYAQLEHQPVLTAKVSFDFNVGTKTFPAGEYRIVRVAPHTLALRDKTDRLLTSVMTGAVVSCEGRPTPTLKFEMEDGRYLLSEVWPAGTTTGYQLSKPKRQTAVAQNHAAEAEVRASALSSTGKR
jgi:hypothetical protein